MQGDRQNHTRSPCRPFTHLLFRERTNFGNQKTIRVSNGEMLEIKNSFEESNGQILEIKKPFQKSNGQDKNQNI